MTSVRTISLELLRHGPAHNQLISPLTRYIGICGPYNVASITIDLEHWKLEELLTRLSYRRPGLPGTSGDAAIGNAERRQVLAEMGAIVTRIIEANLGVFGRLNGPLDDKTLLELRLVMSATELALLPFELCTTLDGQGGKSDRWLCLQNQPAVCITRSSRTQQEIPCDWRARPKILFITAGVEPLLVRSHLRALLQALDPWLPPEDRPEDSLEKLHAQIRIITNATLDKITALCQKNRFTHVHILAHGVPDSDRMGAPVGLLLDASRGGKNRIVSAGQLAAALNIGPKGCNGVVAGLPTVLTLASCESGHAGDPVHSHGSLAHLLHTMGIPLVIGSQFPLSYRGSVVLTRSLYTGLLRGEDPRIVLRKTRLALHASCTQNRHDWASVVGYMALPDDFAEQRVDFQYNQAKMALDVSMAALEEFMQKTWTTRSGQAAGRGSAADDERHVRWLLQRLETARQCLPDDPSYATEVLALNGAMAKRRAEVYFNLASSGNEDGSIDNQKKIQESLAQLNKALDYYRQAARECVRESPGHVQKKRALHWSLTQYLSLMAVLFGTFNDDARQKWHAAMYSARVDMEAADLGSENWIWATASAMELHLLRHGAWNEEKEQEDACEKARDLACRIHRYGSTTNAVKLTLAQLRRYTGWWAKLETQCRPEGVCEKRIKAIRSQLKRLAEDLCVILEPEAPSCPGGRVELGP